MSETPQKTVLETSRKRFRYRRMDATRIRAIVYRTISEGAPKRGGILAALRRSPLVGAELNLTRPMTIDR
jgi:(2Fe-2S) ferredoxin